MFSVHCVKRYLVLYILQMFSVHCVERYFVLYVLCEKRYFYTYFVRDILFLYLFCEKKYFVLYILCENRYLGLYFASFFLMTGVFVHLRRKMSPTIYSNSQEY